ncbi:MAG: SpoIIE family protein phosphatase [Bacteroidales bacterium]|nr:SpoIIE family protein phosphatase [Bacteroidales bacterium]
MRRLLKDFRRSLSVSLSTWVVLFAALIFLAALGSASFFARRYVREEAVKRADQVLENSALRLSNILEDVEIAADNLEWLVYRNLDHPDRMMDYTRSTLQGIPGLSGCSISFEPYYYPDRQYWSVYSGYLADGSIQSEQEGNDDYQYFYLDWYQLPKLLNQPCWTEPYSDWEPDDDVDLLTKMLVSYSKPLTDSDGNYIGCVTLDISLKWLSENLSSVRPYPHSYVVLLSRGGTFLVHPFQDKLFHETIYTRTLADPDSDLEALGHAMQDQEEGMRALRIDGRRSYVFYTPLKSTGWSMAIVCPRRDVFSGFNRLRRMAVGLALLGLLFMFVVCFRVIGKTLKPLRELASQARNIADGHFDTVLPDDPRQDEIGTLSRSFAHMQTSLVSYIDELTRTTAKRERIESELEVARNIQMGMIPRQFPERDDIDLYGETIPAKEVGGDLYDFSLQDGKLYFCIGDVSGKGIPASLFMAMARTIFRVAVQKTPAVSEIAREINESLTADNDQLMFVTMFLGAVDLGSGRMSFCSCGHNPPALLSPDGKASFLDCIPNVPLGVTPGYAFQEQGIADVRGVPLLMYTDGLNEAENAGHEPFGNDQLLAVLENAPFVSAQEAVSRMNSALRAHVAGAEASDDLTMLCVRIAFR